MFYDKIPTASHSQVPEATSLTPVEFDALLNTIII